MAKLGARGRREIFRIEREDHIAGLSRMREQKALMTDGAILIKRGQGTWTTYGKIKPGLTAEDALRINIGKGYHLVDHNPSYLTMDRTGGTISDVAGKPIRTEAKARGEAKARARRAEEAKGRAAYAAVKNGPGYYVTNGTTVGSGRRAADLGPYNDLSIAINHAWEKLHELRDLKFNYLLPVKVIEARDRTGAMLDVGTVMWHSSKVKESDESNPGFYIVMSPDDTEVSGPYESLDAAEDNAYHTRDGQLPYRIVEARTGRLAAKGQGHVWWQEGVHRGPPVDPRQQRFNTFE